MFIFDAMLTQHLFKLTGGVSMRVRHKLAAAGKPIGATMSLRHGLEPFANSGREAAHLIEEILDSVVVALRHDRRFTGIPLSEFELLFADIHRDAERRLFNKLRDRVHLDDIDYVERVEP